jgi:MOSC domain-containing protein
MITVRSLHIYPVKSCRGIGLDSAVVVPTGLRFDRQWMVVAPDGGFLSQRSNPAMARVSTRIEDDNLILEARGRSRLEIAAGESGGDERWVTVWQDRCPAVSAGLEAAEWFSSLLGTPCELVRQPDAGVRQVNTRYAERGDRVAFADGFPFLLISRASLDELNSRLVEQVPADRFRANIIVEGCDPYAEDHWTEITIGGIGFRVAKPCARCVVITTDQTIGARSPEPLRTLAGYRTVDGKVFFGQNLVHQNTGSVQVGDEVHTNHRL